MKIDGKRIRLERAQRAWSQDHLAHVTGLGLRTIQRIETTGAASYESVKSLAAAFGLTAAELLSSEEVPKAMQSELGVRLTPVLQAKPSQDTTRNGSASSVLHRLLPAFVLVVGIFVGTTIAARLSHVYWWLAALVLASAVVIAGILRNLPQPPSRIGIRNALLLAATCFTASGIVAHIGPNELGMMVAVLGGGTAVVLDRPRPCARATVRNTSAS